MWLIISKQFDFYNCRCNIIQITTEHPSICFFMGKTKKCIKEKKLPFQKRKQNPKEKQGSSKELFKLQICNSVTRSVIYFEIFQHNQQNIMFHQLNFRDSQLTLYLRGHTSEAASPSHLATGISINNRQFANQHSRRQNEFSLLESDLFLSMVSIRNGFLLGENKSVLFVWLQKTCVLAKIVQRHFPFL